MNGKCKTITIMRRALCPRSKANWGLFADGGGEIPGLDRDFYHSNAQMQLQGLSSSLRLQGLYSVIGIYSFWEVAQTFLSDRDSCHSCQITYWSEIRTCLHTSIPNVGLNNIFIFLALYFTRNILSFSHMHTHLL